MFEEYNFNDNQFLWRRSLLGRLWRALIVRPALAWQDWRCRRAETYLLTHDPVYRSKYIIQEALRRGVARFLEDEGVSSGSLEVPDRLSIINELPPMAWPHGLDK